MSNRRTDNQTVESAETCVERARRERPEDGQKMHVRSPAGEVAGRLPVSFFVYFDALEELIFASSYRDEPCVALLDGELGLDDQGTFVELTGFSDLQYTGEARTMHLPLRNALAGKLEGVDQRSEALEVPGFFVGMAGSRGELTEEVARLHLSLFNVPYQVVLVADPETRRLGLYGRGESGRFVNETFGVVYQAQ